MNFKKAFISELSPAKYNPRKDLQPTDPEYQAIKRSIEEFGYVDPIIINSDNTVIGGHQRLKVLKEMGKAQIDVVQIDIPKNKEKALNVALNKISGDWDQQRLAVLLQELKDDGLFEFTGFDEKEFDQLLRDLHKDDEPLDTEPQISRAEELRKEWGTALGQVWQLGEHRVMCGDCTVSTNVDKLMQGEKADMVFADPPYGVDYTGKTKDALKIKGDKTTEAFGRCWGIVADYIKSGAGQYICCPPGSRQREFMEMFEEQSVLSQVLIWVKNSMVLGHGDYHYQHEPILYGWKKGGNHTFYGDRKQVSCWFIDRPTSSREHPTMKPIGLPFLAIQNSSKSDDSILDPFLGSGTTLIACENLGRKCRGMEIDPGYVAVILQRYKDTFKKEPVLL